MGRGCQNAGVDETNERVAVNRETWNGVVDAHIVAYGAAEFADDPIAISPIVERDLTIMARFLPSGSPRGLTLIHLQCHIGTDTLSWARLGAHVTGLDFSGAAIQAADELAVRSGLAAAFIESSIDDAAHNVGSRFDVVYTGIGAITWLPDLAAWADAIFALLEPGGLFFVRDGHPMLYALDYERNDDELTVTHPYFGTGEAQRSDGGLTYATDGGEHSSATTYEWTHSLSQILQPLLAAGLELLWFEEHTDIPWRSLPQMVPVEAGFALPHGRDRLPLTFSLVARRPLGNGS